MNVPNIRGGLLQKPLPGECGALPGILGENLCTIHHPDSGSNQNISQPATFRTLVLMHQLIDTAVRAM
jgi:hypothetical protein